ncbi:M48 family metallopeptidase [Gluconobacter morbifer]|uniref:YgjP-like metallopeptidase domain-containing protein n=1 Tax=Gluconobacter morbifer G707 TaxID=1088869 RepID=G6XJ13_9PROT|nr:SprT family zinc-dependent metalloprotease [Gluconobacter morbifer]EHH68129.1 hypothetical protein GMO_14790 [Gluconobacter morbifer G707]
MLSPTVPLVWKQSKRARRMTLRIDPGTGNVVVTVPDRVSKTQAVAFVHEHMDWIENALASLPEKAPLTAGNMVLIEGHRRPILHAPEARRGVWLDEDGVHVSGDAAHTERRVRDFLRVYAKECLSATVAMYSTKTGLKPSRLDLRDTRSRWGSCTRQGRIMLSWRLVMAPLSIRDYVIIHELAHLRHFNHGKDFWSLVDSFCPNGHTGRLAAERWLSENGAVLLRSA